MKNIGVIPAAGKGSRAFPQSRETQKVMLKVGGKPILQRNIELLRDQLGVKLVYIIIGYLGHQIRKYFADGSGFGVEIVYIEQKKLNGIGGAVHLTREYIDAPFFVVLGDEFYVNSNHREMLTWLKRDFNAVCGFRKELDAKRIMKNYTGTLDDKNRVILLEEKPKSPKNMLMGCGTYLLQPILYDYIEKTPPSSIRGEMEITDAINSLASGKEGVHAFFLNGDYVNVNSVEDLHLARQLVKKNV